MYHALRIIVMVAEDGAIECGMVTWRAAVLLLSLLFVSGITQTKGWEAHKGNMEVCGFCC